MASIRIDHVSKRFESVTAVDDVQIDVADGEFLALLGPSGCGKTTTLRMLAGLERPTSGTITIGGRDMTQVEPQKRNLAMVFQDYALYPHMTVSQNVGYPLRIRRRPRDEIDQQTRETAELLGLETLLARRPGQLSGGQQQRVALARALVYEPAALLLDEPLSNLDAQLRLEARSMLRRFQRRLGLTTIYVTHDQSEAMALADRVAVMSKGRLLQLAPPLEVYRRPTTTFVAGFIGSPPMNLLPATWEDGMARLEGGGGACIDPGPRRDAVAAAFSPGARLWIGVRPEHVGMSPDGDNSLQAGIEAVEPLGSETLIRVRLGAREIVVRRFGDDNEGLQVGAQVAISFDGRRMLWYGEGGDLVVG